MYMCNVGKSTKIGMFSESVATSAAFELQGAGMNGVKSSQRESGFGAKEGSYSCIIMCVLLC